MGDSSKYVVFNEMTQLPKVVEASGNKYSVIEGVIGELMSLHGISEAYYIGCGSSYYAALGGAIPLLRSPLNMKTLTQPASEFLFYYSDLVGRRIQRGKSIVVLFSRSGETKEVLLALDESRKRGAKTIGFTCSKGSYLDRNADYSIVVEECLEEGVYMTKSFAALYLLGTLTSIAMLRLNNIHVDLNLSREITLLKEALVNVSSGVRALEDIAAKTISKKAFAILAPGNLYPVALEASLKFKEIAYTFSEAIHALEFRHGHNALLERRNELQLIVLSLSKDSSHEKTLNLYRELAARGFDALLFSDESTADYFIPWSGGVYLAPIAYILPLYYIAFLRSLLLGYNPDKPMHISRVVLSI
ncbi:MAG: SIS domain-containing protein [Sulfolobales archaeon]|nr:SIS domain-containing protein [Sulfolobales archaeon]MCX8199447.1 SIS domain-containing protein [Sulfolobales archaeon]MDW8170238.1 SIS domain-containing protein [Desulfurococcaceae archaeon]